jgi:hypothetical protein
MLLKLQPETRADLLLETPVEQLAPWLSLQPETIRTRLLGDAPVALQQAIRATPPASAEDRFALANEARASLSDGLHRMLRRDGLEFQALLG